MAEGNISKINVKKELEEETVHDEMHENTKALNPKKEIKGQLQDCPVDTQGNEKVVVTMIDMAFGTRADTSNTTSILWHCALYLAMNGGEGTADGQTIILLEIKRGMVINAWD